MNSQTVTINLAPGSCAPAVVRVSQYDYGRPIVFNILDGTKSVIIGSSATITVVGTKPSGLGFSENALAISGGAVSVNTTYAMTQECGMIPAEVRIKQTGEDIGTANFILAVEPSPHPEGTTDGTQETMADLETRLQAEIDAIAGNVLPKVVSVRSEMVNKSQIYVYGGNESGYIPGNWYYWNSGVQEWVSGGVYCGITSSDLEHALRTFLANNSTVLEDADATEY